MKYTVFYKKIQIGELEVNDKGQHRYTPNMKNLETVKDSIKIFYELTKKSNDWHEPIPLFENRIKDAKKFKETDYISNQTDEIILVKQD